MLQTNAMKHSIFVVLLYFCSYVYASDIVTKCYDTKGFYWRDYTGIIPEDAYPGGRDVNGSISYIGQALHGNLLIPGEIVASEQRMHYEWGFREFTATENVKIFCTQRPEEFYWVITTDKDFKTLTGKKFVVGGYEPNNIIYIGRTSDGRKLLGKVTVNADKNAILHFTDDGKGVFSESFEILAVAGAH